MIHKQFRLVVIFLLTLAVLCAGCAGGKVNPLRGTSWMLQELNGKPALLGHEPTLIFETDQVSGNGSCNHFSGSYQVKGDKLTFESLASTLMACAQVDVMDQESAFFNALQATARFELNQDQLWLKDAGGATVLIFVPL